eukprot:711803-Ditylum_brightwellii.AAC.1
MLPSWTSQYKQDETALIDSAASLILLQDATPAKKTIVQEPSKQIIIPNGTIMHTKETINLQLNKVPQRGRRDFCLKSLMHNLVAVAELCNSGCKVNLDKNDVVVQKDGEKVVKGWRDRPTRLWRIPIVDKPAQPPNNQHEYANIAVMPIEYANAAVAINSADYTMHLANI